MFKISHTILKNKHIQSFIYKSAYTDGKSNCNALKDDVYFHLSILFIWDLYAVDPPLILEPVHIWICIDDQLL